MMGYPMVYGYVPWQNVDFVDPYTYRTARKLNHKKNADKAAQHANIRNTIKECQKHGFSSTTAPKFLELYNSDNVRIIFPKLADQDANIPHLADVIDIMKRLLNKNPEQRRFVLIAPPDQVISLPPTVFDTCSATLTLALNAMFSR